MARIAIQLLFRGRSLASRSIKMLVKVVFEVSDEGGYTVHVPGLPGCISEGETLEEARENIREAIALYLEPSDEIAAAAGSIVEEISV
jgi:predicted RNase H-like HicB family nuclease